MRTFSPTVNGFRLIFRRPFVPIAEIAWRWSFAIAAWFLCDAFLLEYAKTLPVDSVDRLLLATRQPVLIMRALQRIFHGSELRFTESGILLAIGVVVAWIVLGAVGRIVTLGAIAEELHVTRTGVSKTGIPSLMTLSFLRVSITLAALVTAFGSAFAASGVWASTHLSVVNALRLWVVFLFFVWIAWAVLNWLLASACIFVVADGQSAFDAIAATINWTQERLWSIIGAGVWFGIAHAVVFALAGGASFAVLGFADFLGPNLVVLLEFAITAAYFALADSLYIGRLAAYFSLVREDEISALVTKEKEPISGPGTSAIDQTELILSDVPLPAI
ncbi:MAG TPA: hypothetical protein VFA90_03310 [Terriglobales bacterium]|nr:hypothetical protein [Terriglobales bacterium]